jgi:hypothetical protein
MSYDPNARMMPDFPSDFDPPNKNLERPQIRTRRTRKKNRLLIDLLGWIGGGLAAVCVSWYIIASGWLDQPGSVESPVHDNQPIDESNNDASSFDDASIEPPATASNRRTTTVVAANPPDTRHQADPQDVVIDTQPSPKQTDAISERVPANPGKPIPVPGKKLAVPDAAEMDTARNRVRELYMDRSKDPSYAGRQRLAKSLLEDALGKPPADTYALIEGSANLSETIGDSLAVLRAWQEFDRHFAIDFWEGVANQVDAAAKHAQFTAQMESYLTAVCELVALADQQHRFDDAARFAAKAATAAKKIGDASLFRRADALKHEFSDIQKLAKQAEKALDDLKQDPSNPKANLTAGRYLCFALRNWDDGLKYVAAGNNPSLSKSAELDQQLASDHSRPDQFIQVGNRWFESAKKSKGFEQRSMMQRALQTYQLAIADAEGLERERIEQLIEDIQPQLDLFIQYLDNPLSGTSGGKKNRQWQFEVGGSVQYDGALLQTQPNQLVLTRGPQRRVLALASVGNALVADSQDGKSTFQIRMLKTQIAELRHYNKATGQIVATFFGHAADSQ